MCGIAGRFHPIQLEVDPDWHIRADALLAHRGPDGSGYYSDHQCELVHRRLALIDLSNTGQQPMANEDGTVQVVFNGEIYNHVELRRELCSRHRFRGRSDTEVLVHLYEDYGISMIVRLRGMFAFAIYDLARKQLFLGRDRFGIKPLYYAIVRDQLVFASEIKAITCVHGFQPQFDAQACYDFLGLSYIPEPATGFSNIWMLPKGHFLVYDSRTLSTPRCYWRLQVRPDNSKILAAAAEDVQDMLGDALRQYIVADVPVATLLSGGIDSSLVASAYPRRIGRPLSTFNVRFPDKDYDETPLARAVANQLGTIHTTIDVTEGCVTSDLALLLFEHFDQPFADTSLIPMYLVARAIRAQGIICTLSGDGGDEVFGGYDSFPRLNQLFALSQLPKVLQSSIAGTTRWAAPLNLDFGRRVRKALELAEVGRNDSALLLAGLANYLTEGQKQALVLPEVRSGLQPIRRLFEDGSEAATCRLEGLSKRMTESLFNVGLPSDMLRKVDMMSMLASIEIRVPLLDERIVEFGVTLPHRLKTDGRRGKLVLRKLADRVLPTSVAKHRKQGFCIPLDVVVANNLFEMIHDFLISSGSRTRGLFDGQLVRRWLGMFDRARYRRRDSSISREGLYQRIFMLLSLELWMRKYRISW
jgi:asparagine synthase (glutamine-hydrolysing)